MANKKEYAMSHGAKINKNCNVEFNRTSDNQLHIKIVTFKGKETVVLTEETFEAICDTLENYRREVPSLDISAS